MDDTGYLSLKETSNYSIIIKKKKKHLLSLSRVEKFLLGISEQYKSAPVPSDWEVCASSCTPQEKKKEHNTLFR